MRTIEQFSETMEKVIWWHKFHKKPVCARTATGRYVFNGQIPLRAMKKQAKEEGFIFNPGEAFCSQDCCNWWGENNVQQP